MIFFDMFFSMIYRFSNQKLKRDTESATFSAAAVMMIYIVFFISCSGMSTEHLVRNYYLTKMDYSDKELDLSYKLETGGFIGVIDPTISAIGYNDNFIIVKQHPRCFSDDNMDKNITNYFIVPLQIKVHNSPDDNKIGPLTYPEFLIKRKELKIPDDLVFSKIFEK